MQNMDGGTSKTQFKVEGNASLEKPHFSYFHNKGN